VYLKITSFAKTSPERGVIIGFIDTDSGIFNPSFKVSSDDDTYGNKIFWINYSNSVEHTSQNIGMEGIIPVPVDLTQGIYKSGHLYREGRIVLADFQDESDVLWSSSVLHLCSEPLEFNIKGSIIPKFSKPFPYTGDTKDLSIEYEFSENSWLFNLQHPNLLLEMSVSVIQSTPFNTEEVILAETKGKWENIASQIEPYAHVMITATLKLDESVLWKQQLACVPDELSSLYVQKNNAVHPVIFKALQHHNLARDAHIFTPFTETSELFLLITKDAQNPELNTLTPYIKDKNNKFLNLESLYAIPLAFKKILWSDGTPLAIPSRVSTHIPTAFVDITNYNFSEEDAKNLLKTMIIDDYTYLQIKLEGIEAIKKPVLVVLDEDKAPLAGAIVIQDAKNIGYIHTFKAMLGVALVGGAQLMPPGAVSSFPALGIGTLGAIKLPCYNETYGAKLGALKVGTAKLNFYI
jgi:hypothetical protein